MGNMCASRRDSLTASVFFLLETGSHARWIAAMKGSAATAKVGSNSGVFVLSANPVPGVKMVCTLVIIY